MRITTNLIAALAVLAASAVCAYGQAAAQAEASAPNQKIVMAHVMPCMSVGLDADKAGGQDNLFNDLPTGPNTSLHRWTDEYLLNQSRPLQAAQQDIAVAKAAGVNTFRMLWAPNCLSNQFSAVMYAYLQAARDAGDFKICPDIWSDLRPQDVAKLADTLKTLAQKYDDIWLRYKGRRVILLQQSVSPKTSYESVIAPLLAEIGGRENVFLVVYVQNPLGPTAGYPSTPPSDWLDNADAWTSWTAGYSYGETTVFEPALRREAAARGKEYWVSACPSFYQSRPSLKREIIKEHIGAIDFMESWQRAIADKSPVVCIDTWNDMSEDSNLMPDTYHGEAYTELNTYFASWYQAGRAPTVEREQVLVFHHPQVTPAPLLPAGRNPAYTYNWLATPPTDYILAVGMFKTATRVTLRAGPTLKLQHDFPAGVSSWLVYSPVIDMSKINDADTGQRWKKDTAIYPAASDTLAITKLDHPLQDATLYVDVSRAGTRLGLFRSHQPIVGAAGHPDLRVIGNVFVLPKP